MLTEAEAPSVDEEALREVEGALREVEGVLREQGSVLRPLPLDPMLDSVDEAVAEAGLLPTAKDKDKDKDREAGLLDPLDEVAEDRAEALEPLRKSSPPAGLR